MTYRLSTTPILALAITLLTLVACGPKEKKSYEKYAVSGLTERADHLRSNLQRAAAVTSTACATTSPPPMPTVSTVWSVI